MSGVAKRVFASVSDQLADKLEKRAEVEGRSLSSLVGYLLERTMEDWQEPVKQKPEVKDK